MIPLTLKNLYQKIIYVLIDGNGVSLGQLTVEKICNSNILLAPLKTCTFQKKLSLLFSFA